MKILIGFLLLVAVSGLLTTSLRPWGYAAMLAGVVAVTALYYVRNGYW